MRKIIIAAGTVLALALPLAAQAQVLQGTANGAQNGAAQGNAAGGPIGGIVGGAIGAGVGAATGAVGTATGIVGTVLGDDERPRFHDYTVAHPHRSYAWSGSVQPGERIPPRGVTLYPIPREYKVDRRYRYAVVNNQAVIVDPRTRQIVDVID